MMCSSWKISVFGIVALMLAFGLIDARADVQDVKHPGDATISVAVNSATTSDGATDRADGNVATLTTGASPTALRATEKLDSLVFTYTLSADEAGRKGTVEILLPGGWRGAFETDNVADERDWAVPPLTGTATAKLEARSTYLKATVEDEARAAGETIIFTILNVTVPNRAGIYDFTVRSNLVDSAVHTNYLDPDTTGNDAIAETTNTSGLSDNGRAYRIRVYGMPSGKGKIELSRSGRTFPKGGDEVDKAYKNHLFATHKEDLGNLMLKFTAPGTMYKGSKVRITIPDGWTALQSDNGGAADPGEVRVQSGPATVLVSGDSDRVLTATTTANMEPGRSFTIAYMKVTSPGNHEDPSAVLTYTFETTTASLLEDTDAQRETIDTEGELTTALSDAPSFDADVPSGTGGTTFPGENPGEEPVVTVTARHGVGTLTLTDGTDAIKYAMAGDDIGRVTFTFGGAAATAKTGSAIGMAKGGQVRIEIDPAWPAPFDATRAGDERLGAVFIAESEAASLKSANGVITATLKEDFDDETDGSFTFTYFVKKVPTVQKTYVFKTSSKSHAQAPFAPLGGGNMPSVDVTAPHGSGEIVLRSGGQVLRQTAKEDKLGDLQFTYTTEGWMAKDAIVQITIPGKWPNVRRDNGNSIRDPGEVILGGTAKAELQLNSTNRTIRAKATEAWRAGATVIVTYKNIQAPGDKGSYPFETRALSFPVTNVETSIALDGALVEPSPSVGVDQTPDGSGTIALSKGGAIFTGASAGDALGDLVFTYTVKGSMESNSVVEIEIPDPWTDPDYDDGDSDAQDTGEVVFGGAGEGSLSLDGNRVTVTTATDLSGGDTFTVTYKNITAPEAGDYDFHVRSTSTPGGTPTALANSPLKVAISAVDPGAVTASVTSTTPGVDLGNLAFTYRAAARLDAGAVIKVVIHEGWPSAFRATSAADDRSGAVTISDNAVLSFDGTRTLIATTNTVLEDNDTVILTYGSIMAPDVEDDYSFPASFSAGGGDPEVSIPSPRIVVRSVPTELTLTTSADNFFVGASITVTATLDQRAPVGGQNVTLTAGSGTFSMTEDGEAISSMTEDGMVSASVTIGDSADSMSEMVYYTNDMAGEVMLTGTAMVGEMELTDSASVTVKSTISNLAVNGMAEAPVTVDAGSTVTVSVIGKPGGGEVKVTQMEEDADGMVTHPTRLPTRALDKDPNQDGVPEGSVRYTRGIPLGDLNDGDYTVTVTLGGENAPIAIKVETARDPVTALTLTASADSFFAGDSIELTVASDVRAPEGGLEVTLSTEPEDSGTFSMTEGGEAISTATIPDAEDSMSVMVYYTNDAAGAVTLMATAGEISDSAEVTVNDLVTSVQVNGMDEPDTVAGNATITVSAIGKDGAATVSVANSAGETVVSEKGMDKAPDADVPEGSASYSRGVALPNLDDGDYTVTVSIAGGSKSVEIEVMEPRDPVTAITVTASDSFFVGDSTQVTIASDVRTPVGGLEVTLSTEPEDSGTFSMTKGGAAISTAMIPDAEDSMSVMVYYTGSAAGAVTLTATAGEVSGSAEVTVKSTISNLQVNGMDGSEESPVLPVKGGATISVTASGKDGRSGLVITNAAGDEVVSRLGLDGEADDEGNVAYSRDITLPSLADGDYTVTVTIAGESASIMVEVLNDQTAPILSSATAWPDVVANGDDVALRVKVTMNESMVAIDSVTVDVSALDDAQTEPVMLAVLPSEPAGTYGGFHRISMSNGADDGDVMLTFTATDVLENSGTATASITLKNDVTAPALTMESAEPATATEGTSITISVNGGESGLTVTADASAIGGDAMESLTEGMDEDMMGTGMYSADVVVTGAADGAQSITITATDGSGNSSEAMVSVMIDNTGPALTMASADPAMAKDGTMVTISVMTEAGATVMANASAIGGDAATALSESADTAGSYSAMVTVADGTMDGDHMISITGTDALGNEGDAASVTVTVDNTAPMLSDAAITPDWALNDDMVTISVMTEAGATVTANASAIGGDAATALSESADTAGMYSAEVTVTGAMGGDQMVSITASDALGNMSEAASASVSIHVVTSASFSPADVSTGDMVMVSAMGTAGLTATFSVFDANGNNIVTDGSLTEDAETAGSYSGSFEVVIDAHPTGTYWVSATIGQASMTADGALTIDHLAQFTLSIGAGTHLIHVPLDVTHIDGVAATIDTVGDLYKALDGSVNFIISLGADGSWNSYLGDASAGGAADAAIGADTGLIAVMSSAASLTLAGNALGTGGASAINLVAGNNLVGVPLDPAAGGLSMISDAVTLSQGAVSAVVVSNAAGNGFNTIAQADDPGDGPIMGGRGYIVVAGATASIPVIGMAWDNTMADDMGNGMTASAAPSIGFQTPVLQVQGKLIDEAGMVSRDGLNVTVKNVTRGTTLGSTTAADDYSMTFVKLDSSAAKVGDVLEIRADSSNPLLGVRSVQHVVTADDVRDSRIDLPDLVTYEIPAQTELLANYPNPFNPETWIPFRLAEDSNVSLSIYGASGSLVRSIDIGFTPAAVYEGRSDAIYWDGRNNFGEQVSSGIYFYHLSAGSFSATRKMVIVK